MMKKTSNKSPRNCEAKKRFLVSVSVQGSAGPLRLVVNDDDSTGRVIDAALKLYAREARMPVIGSDPDRFFLYCHDRVGCHVILGACEAIGLSGARRFVLAPKKPDPGPERGGAAAASWKAWLPKSLSFKNLTTSH